MSRQMLRNVTFSVIVPSPSINVQFDVQSHWQVFRQDVEHARTALLLARTSLRIFFFLHLYPEGYFASPRSSGVSITRLDNAGAILNPKYNISSIRLRRSVQRSAAFQSRERQISCLLKFQPRPPSVSSRPSSSSSSSSISRGRVANPPVRTSSSVS